MITMIVDTLLVFYYEKMVGYMPSSFVDLVFAGERIEVGLKRGKSDHHALINDKTGENEEGENKGEITNAQNQKKIVGRITTQDSSSQGNHGTLCVHPQ